MQTSVTGLFWDLQDTMYVQDVVHSSLSHCFMSSYSFLLKQLEPEDLPESAALNNKLSPGAGNPW